LINQVLLFISIFTVIDRIFELFFEPIGVFISKIYYYIIEINFLLL